MHFDNNTRSSPKLSFQEIYAHVHVHCHNHTNTKEAPFLKRSVCTIISERADQLTNDEAVVCMIITL